MEDKVQYLRRELKRRQIQFDSLYDFASSLYTSLEQDHILRVFASTLMGQMAVSPLLLVGNRGDLCFSRGVRIDPEVGQVLRTGLGRVIFPEPFVDLETDDPLPGDDTLAPLLLGHRIRYLINVSDDPGQMLILGLGRRFSSLPLTEDELGYALMLSRYARIALENAWMVQRLLTTQRMEEELRIAKKIQQDLLPSALPTLQHMDMAVVYEPLREVGGDYYDVLSPCDGATPVLLADVEGKGLSAALLAASSQAVFHALHGLYRFSADRFVGRANQLIHDLAKGSRFITLLWLLLRDGERTITCVNAGHVSPILRRADGSLHRIQSGGLLTGLLPTATYTMEEVRLEPGDRLVCFTDGVVEVEGPDGEEVGERGVVEALERWAHLDSQAWAEAFTAHLKELSKERPWRDDYTLLVITGQP